MSIEAFFLLNQLMDFFVIAAVLGGLGRFRPLRAIAGSAVASCYAVAAWSWLPALGAWPVQLLLLLAIVRLTVGAASPALMVHGALWLAIATAFAGACAALAQPFGFGGALCAGLSGAMVVCVQMRVNRARRQSGTIRVCAVSKGQCIRFDALVDSGNRLREPLSGQPVLILDSALAARLRHTGPRRQVAYGSVGGQGMLNCFRPDAVYILHGRKRSPTPPAWIAASPNRLPGGISALAPPELTAP